MQQACFILGRAGLPLTAVLLLNSRWGETHSHQFGARRLFSTGSTSLPTTVCERAQDQFTASKGTQLSSTVYLDDESHNNGRTGKTAADDYFREHGDIPRPSVTHAVLQLPQDVPEDKPRKGILVIGDIHGCYHELIALVAKAKQENDGMEFLFVICVGDLVNKGKHSAHVVRHVCNTDRWLALRGNHDDGALAAALGDESRQRKKKYQWVHELSDQDIMWMANLPYSLRIPASLLGEETDTVIVHAGFVPGKELQYQSRETMVTIREVQKIGPGDSYKIMHSKRNNSKSPVENVHPWASVWKGPFRVIFGHDARRGLQLHEWATGLDTGACYGKKLTGIILGLPERKLVQVDALEVHSPPGGDSD
jgi:predicted phosphodiesterase